MLLRLELENFGAFRDRVVLNLEAPARSDAEVREVPLAPRTPVLALVYGPNASGKTTLLDGFAQLALAVRDSHRLWDPEGGTNAKPFRLREDPDAAPSQWRVSFARVDAAGAPGIFEYDVAMGREAVRREVLRFRSAETGRWRTVYRRIDQVVSSAPASIKALTPRLRPNALLLSLGAQENEETTRAPWEWFTGQIHLARDLSSPTLRSRALEQLDAEDEMTIARSLLPTADLGVEDVRGVPLTASDRDRLRDMSRRLTEAVPGLAVAVPDGEIKELEFAHSGEGGRRYWLPESEESEGTRTFLVAGVMARQVLASGGVFVIDELDRSLHPTLVEAIVDSFRSRVTNPLGAQLLATTHDTHLFGRSSLNPLSRHEVWFTDKTAEGVASLYRLADFGGVRPEVDQEHRYLVGRFGAVPTPSLLSPVNAHG